MLIDLPCFSWVQQCLLMAFWKASLAQSHVMQCCITWQRFVRETGWVRSHGYIGVAEQGQITECILG